MKHRILFISISLIIGLFLGWLFFHSSQKNEKKIDQLTESTKGTIWTCSMHHQIRMPQPGKCPICGMELITLVQTVTSSIYPDAIHMSKEAT